MKTLFNRRNALLFTAGVGALLLGQTLQSRLEGDSPHPAVRALFDAKILRVDGHRYPLELHKGKPLLINVWAPWCAPCVEELPELSTLSQSSVAKSVQFIGLGADNAEHISDFSVKHPVAFPLLVAGAAGIALSKGLGNVSGALPFTALIDASGQVLAKKTGRVSSAEVQTWLAQLPNN